MFIRPRYHEPTSYERSNFGYIPKWVWYPYKFVKFVYNFALEITHSESAGIFKLMIPLGIFLAYEKIKHLNSHNIFFIIVTIFLALVGTILKMRMGGKEVYESTVHKWEEDLSYYGEK